MLPSGIANGTVTAGVLAGRLGSSTRAELVVGLAAMDKPFPVHLQVTARLFATKLALSLLPPTSGPGAPMPCKGMATCGSTFMRGLLLVGPTPTESHGIKLMLPWMLFTRVQYVLTMLCTTALRTTPPAKAMRPVGVMA